MQLTSTASYIITIECLMTEITSPSIRDNYANSFVNKTPTACSNAFITLSMDCAREVRCCKSERRQAKAHKPEVMCTFQEQLF